MDAIQQADAVARAKRVASTMRDYATYPRGRAYQARAAFAAEHYSAFSDGGRSVEGERNDCTVRALTAVTAMTYEEAHESLRVRDGRKNGRGTWPYKAYAAAGATLHAVALVNGRAPTLAAWLPRAPLGFLIVSVRAHVFAVIDRKVVMDTHIVGPRTRVEAYWKFPTPTL